MSIMSDNLSVITPVLDLSNSSSDEYSILYVISVFSELELNSKIPVIFI